MRVLPYPLRLFYSEEDGGWIADLPDLEMCSAFGASAVEAVREARNALEGWLTAAEEIGIPIPPPYSYRQRR